MYLIILIMIHFLFKTKINKTKENVSNIKFSIFKFLMFKRNLSMYTNLFEYEKFLCIFFFPILKVKALFQNESRFYMIFIIEI